MVETRGKRAFDLDGASERIQFQARGTLVSVIRPGFGQREEKIGHCRYAGISAKLGAFGKRNVNQLNFLQNNSRSFGCCSQRNLGISTRGQRLKCAPAGAH